jgi:hypothetical protein
MRDKALSKNELFFLFIVFAIHLFTLDLSNGKIFILIYIEKRKELKLNTDIGHASTRCTGFEFE